MTHRVVTLRLEPATHAALVVLAFDLRMSMNELLLHYVNHGIASNRVAAETLARVTYGMTPIPGGRVPAVANPPPRTDEEIAEKKRAKVVKGKATKAGKRGAG